MAELFERFEVDRVPRWPMMSRLVALSVVLHGVFFVAAAYLPSLRSLLYVAGTFSGFQVVSEDYDRTLIGQRATIVKLEPHERLIYPPDYFGTPPTPEDMMLGMDPIVVQPAPPPPPVISYGPRPRRSKAEPTPTPEPSPSPEVAEASPTPTPTAAEEEAQKKADEELDRIARENGIKRPPAALNTKPFEDVAKEGKKLVDEGKLNLNSAIEVAATGRLNPDGTLDRSTVNLDWKTTSDETTAALAQQLLTAFSESKILALLEGAQEVRIELKLDQQNFSFRIMSDLPSEEVASKFANGYGLLLVAGRYKKQGTNEGELYKNLKVDRNGKQFVVSFDMAKEAAGKMITEMLAKKKAKDEAAAAPSPTGKG